MRIDSITVQQARNTDIIAFLEKYCGFGFLLRGGVYRCKQHSSLVVKGDCLSWYWHSKGIGGYGAIDFLMKVENMPFREAIETVAGERFVHPSSSSDSGAERDMVQDFDSPEKIKILILPEKANSTQSRLYDYLCNKRGIDRQIVTTLLNENKIYEDKRGNIVFVGFDEKHKPRFASLRGTYGDSQFRMDCTGSDKRYGFNMTYSPLERLYVFESPIDAMSHAAFENILENDKYAWRNQNRLSLGGTSNIALVKFLEMNSYTTELIFCLDTDHAGQEAAINMAKHYRAKGLDAWIKLPIAPDCKDFNDDLLTYRHYKKLAKKIERDAL